MKQRDAVLIVLIAVAVYVAIWTRCRFTCDDAYVAFRAISNRRLGGGYTQNIAPFQAVEAYPSFAWVVLLDLAWSVFGVEPPVAAGALGLVFGVGSVVLTALLARRVIDRPLHVGLILLATVTNRTFVTWTTSGLETSLFIFLVLAWVYASQTKHVGWLAALLVLTRPDGWFFAIATVVIARKRPLHLAPLVGALAHLAWRRIHYGAWLPQTWFTEPAPAATESGSTYLMSFVLEYAYWGWLALGLLCALKVPRGSRRALLVDPRTPVVVALFVHFAYYTFRLGGDPLEYRVYAHLVPLLAVSFFALAAHAGFDVMARAKSFAVVLALGSVVPWLHFVTHEPVGGFYPLYGTAWDTTQKWLTGHGKNQRLHQMKRFADDQWRHVPPRAVGEKIDASGHPVLALAGPAGAGIASWALPTVAVVDKTTRPTSCYHPNVTLSGDAVNVDPRELTEAQIHACEGQARASTSSSEK